MSAYDPQSVAALMTAASIVGGLGWTVRIGIRKDRDDRDDKRQQATQDQITAAIKAEREHQRLIDAQEANAELRKRLRDHRPDGP